MNVTRRSFIAILASALGSKTANAAKPTVFDFYEYVQRRKAATESHEEPWLAATIRGIDRAKRRLWLTHSPAPGFGMPTMTMTLDVDQKIDLAPLKVGRRVDIRIGKNLNRIEVIDIRGSPR